MGGVALCERGAGATISITGTVTPSRYRHWCSQPACRNCAVQQQAQYGGSTAQCGQLVITAAQWQAVGRHRDRHDRRQEPPTFASPPRVRRSRARSTRQTRRHDHRSSGNVQRNAADVEAGPAARCRRGLQHHRRQSPSRRQAGSVAPAGGLPVRSGAERSSQINSQQPLRSVQHVLLQPAT